MKYSSNIHQIGRKLLKKFQMSELAVTLTLLINSTLISSSAGYQDSFIEIIENIQPFKLEISN